MRAIVAERFGGYQNLKLADMPEPAVPNGPVFNPFCPDLDWDAWDIG